MENKSYQELLIELFTTCLNVHPDLSKEEAMKEYIYLMRMSSDICADLAGNLNSVLSMMILSLQLRPDFSFKERSGFVYGMNAAYRDVKAVDLSQKEKFERAISEFRCVDEHFDVYDIDKATKGYRAYVANELHPKFLEKK